MLPPRGKVGVFFGAWHTAPILRRVLGKKGAAKFEHNIEEIVRLERMLCDEGVLLLKYWFHISKKQHKKRLEQLGEKPEAPYRNFVKISEDFVTRTSTAESPWIVIPGADPHYRALSFGRHLLAAMRERLDRKSARKAAKHAPQPSPIGELNPLRALQLDKWQQRLNELSRDSGMRATLVVCVFEGNDAAGKGAPTEEERAQPYLWRFWRYIPRRGRFVFFDRSWYGRVLVERVEGLTPQVDWIRAYSEINDFELALLRRFKQRENVSFKRFKITPEDWRNREKWNDYEAAVCDMVDRTSTSVALWTLVEANNKYFARIKVLKTICEALEAKLA